MGCQNSTHKTHEQNTGADAVEGAIRIVLVGKTGVGKSELGNSLFGRSVFEAAAHMSSVTVRCSRQQQYIESINSTLILIDTPGLFDTQKSNKESTEAIVECIKLSKPGPHVFIIVVSLASRFTSEDQQTVDYIENIFGEKCCEFMIVVFTNKQQSDVEIDDTWVRHADQEPLKPLLEKCKYRYSSIDNKGKKHKDVKSILDLIKQTIKDNNNHFYTGEMYEEAEILYMKYLKEEKEKERLKKDNEQLVKEKDEFKLKYEKLEKENKWAKKLQREVKEKKANEDAKNETSSSYDAQLIPIGYFNDSSNVGIPSVALSSEISDEIQLKSYVFNTKSSKIRKPQRGRGKMPEEQYTIIQSNYTMLLDNIQPDVLCQALFEKGVFDDDDLEQIKKEEGNGRKAVTEKLLQLLFRCGPEAFDKFMTCLHQTGHDAIVTRLQSDEVFRREDRLVHGQKENNNEVKFHVACGRELISPLHEESLKCKDMNKYKLVVDKYIQDINTTDGLGSTPLLKACISQYHPIEKLILLQQSGADINKTNNNNNNALHLACDLGSLDSVKYLIEELQFNIETPGFTGRTPLHQSSQSKIAPVEKMNYLISKGVHVKRVNNNTNNALHIACYLGSLGTVKYIIEALQFNIETRGFNGQTAALVSSQSKISPVEKINYLISRGVNVKTVDNNNDNALHIACRLGSLNTVKYLIEELQFNIETPGFNDQTSLLHSCKSVLSPVEKMNYLISKGVNVRTVDNNNNNALHLACHLGRLDSVKYIIEELQFNIETPGFDGQTPLHQSSQSAVSPVEKMKYLISKGVNVKTIDHNNDNSLHLACDIGSLDTVEYLIEKLQFNIETPGFNGQTPLHQSSQSNVSPVEKMQYLISKGVNVKTVDNTNNNALHLACRFGSLDSVKYIIEELQFNIETPGFDGQTPVLVSSQSKISPVEKMNYLNSKGVNVKTVDNNNNNALHLACSLGSLDSVKYIIDELQFNIETPGFNCQTVLVSSRSKISPVGKIHYLISKGVHVEMNNHILDLACEWGILETVIFLVESGCNINPSDGKKPLLYCSQSELQPVDKMKYLISVGAKLTQQDKQFYISRAQLTETKEFLETL